MSYRTTVRPLTNVSVRLTELRISASTHDSSRSVCTLNCQGAVGCGSVAINLNASRPSDWLAPAAAAAGISVKPLTADVLRPIPSSAETEMNPLNLPTLSGCGPVNSTV